MTTDTTAAPADLDTAPADHAPARVPVYAAGHGEPDLALRVLTAAGWTAYEDNLANKTLVSPDGQVTCEFGPETSRYAHNARGALWEIRFTHPNPYLQMTWTAHFGDQVPAEAIAAFLRALTDPAGLDPDRAA
jgi:hypothetical protein